MEEAVYLSVNPESYKSSKLRILNSEESLLHSLKTIHNLRVLTRQKNDLKITLQKSVAALHSMVDSMILKMPNPNVPEKLRYGNVNSGIEKKGIKDNLLKRKEIEEELLLVREKLKALND